MNLSVTIQPGFALMPPPSSGQQQTAPIWTQFVPFLLIIVIFYVALIRPQQRRARQHDTLMKSIKAGDKVVVSGGILATVITVKDKSLSVRSADAKFEVLKSAVTEITERAGEAGPA